MGNGSGSKSSVIAGLMLSAVLSIPAIAAPDSALSAGDRSAVIQTLATKVRENYVYPDVGERVAAALLKKDAGGGYASAASAGAFSAALSKDLREFGDDKHFRAFPDERFR